MASGSMRRRDGLDEPLRYELAAEVPLVELLAEDGLVNVLELAERETRRDDLEARAPGPVYAAFLRQHRELIAQAIDGERDDARVIERDAGARERRERNPLRVCGVVCCVCAAACASGVACANCCGCAPSVAS